MLSLVGICKNSVKEIKFCHRLGNANSLNIIRLFNPKYITEEGDSHIKFNVETLKTSNDYKILISITQVSGDEDNPEITPLAEFAYHGEVQFLKSKDDFYYIFDSEPSTFEILGASCEGDCVRNTKTPLVDALSFHINKHMPFDTLLSYIENVASS